MRWTSPSRPNPTCCRPSRPRCGATRVRNVLRQRTAVIGFAILGFLVLVALFADVIAPFPPNTSMLDLGLEGVARRPTVHPPPGLPGRPDPASHGPRLEPARHLQPGRPRLAGLALDRHRDGHDRDRHRHADRGRRRVLQRDERQHPHAPDGRPPVVPEPDPGHRHRHGPGTRPLQRDDRHRHRGDPHLRSRHARVRAIRPRDRLRDRVAGARRILSRDPLAPDPAQRDDAAHRAGHARESVARSWRWRPCRSSAWARSHRPPSGAR